MLYQLRHGGASHELLTGFRDVPGPMKRGRWKTLASVRRYEKGGRVHQQVHQAPRDVVLRGRNLVTRIGRLLVAPGQVIIKIGGLPRLCWSARR